MGLFDRFKTKTRKENKESVFIQPIHTQPKKFWGYCFNEMFDVYCNGATVYVYDKDGQELAKFKDVPYAYRAKFIPNSNMLIVKSTAGFLAIYDLDTMTLIKKITTSQIGAQDEGFVVTPSGKYLLNIEKPVSSLYTQITVYETTNFEVVKTLFKDEQKLNIKTIEFETKQCFVLGFVRNDEGVYDYGFIGELLNKGLKVVKRLEKEEFEEIRAFKTWEEFGFTEKEYENSSYLKEKESFEYFTLKDVCEKKK